MGVIRSYGIGAAHSATNSARTGANDGIALDYASVLDIPLENVSMVNDKVLFNHETDPTIPCFRGLGYEPTTGEKKTVCFVR